MKKTYAASFVILAMLTWRTAIAEEVVGPGRYTVFNIVTIRPGEEGEAAAACEEYVERTGQSYCLHMLTLHPEGRPAMDKVERCVASYRAFVNALGHDTKVKPGILLQAILGHWPRTDKDIEPWQRTVDIRGSEVRFCPLDPRFQAYIREVGRRLAAERPAVIMSDDDVRFFSPHAECFCPLHVAAYNTRTGMSLSSDAMRNYIASLAYDHPHHLAFTDLQEEAVSLVVRILREAVDSVDPAIPCGVCQPGWPWERARTEGLARIFAGSHRPFLRLGTGRYTEHAAKYEFPMDLFRTMATAERLRDFRYKLAEVDTYPHNLWSKSAVAFHADLATTAFVGCMGAKAWCVNCSEGGFRVTRNYTDVLAEHRGYYDAIVAAVEGTDLAGVAIPCHRTFPCDNVGDVESRTGSYDSDTWADKVFGVFGVPFRPTEDLGDRSSVFAVAGDKAANRFTDDEWRTMLAGRVLLDGEAVRVLLARGFGEMIGVSSFSERVRFTSERECLCGVEACLPESTNPIVMKADPGAETLSHLVWRKYDGAPDFTEEAPGSVLFRNRLGGLVLSVAYHMNMGDYYQYSVGRQKMLYGWLGRLDAAVVDGASCIDQNMVVLRRIAPDGASLLHAVNLNNDPTRGLKFIFSRRPTAVERLSRNGVWTDVGFEWQNGELSLPVVLPMYGETVLRIR